MSRTVLLATLAGALACGAVPAAADPPATVFQYTGTDGEFSYLLEVRADRRWSRHEHSGSATPSGRLTRRAMRRFTALLDAAPFTTEPVACDGPAVGHAHYEDGRAKAPRVATGGQAKDADGRWVPCESKVDAVTERLPYCLELLADKRDADFTAACAP